MDALARMTILLLYVACSQASGADDALVQRGEVIANTGGCAGCHTPPGGAPYSGHSLGGWTAYNITSDPVAGIGDWSREELLAYLRTGHVNGKAQAAGPMSDIIVNITAPLSDADRNALASYLASIPPANPTGETTSRSAYGQPSSNVDAIRGKPFAGDSLASGARLYMGNCASCHGVQGEGGGDGYYPSLFNNSAVGAASPENLVNVILHGVSRSAAGQEYYMPAFASALTDGEIVSLSSYVLRQFGRGGVKVTLEDVKGRR